METPASSSEDDQCLAADTHQLLHDEVVAEAMGHFMRWQAEGGERRLAGFLQRLSGYQLSRDDVHELVRDTVVRVLSAIRRGQYTIRENVAFGSFVRTVAHNLYINEGRRKANHSISLDMLYENGRDFPDALDALETLIEGAENRCHLAQGMTKLNPMERYKVEAHYLDDRPWAEIAKEVGKSHSAVRKVANRAVGKLRAMLTKQK